MLAVGLFAAAVQVPAHAQWWNPNSGIDPKYRGTQWEPKVVYTHGIYQDAMGAARTFATNNEWDKLERMYVEFLAGNFRTTDGTFMIQALQMMFFHRYDSMSEALINQEMQRWREKMPESRLRPVVEAVRWNSQAWTARGDGADSEVPPESRQMFRERLRRAAKALEESEGVGEESPIWWWAALATAGSMGRPPAQLDAIFERATQRFPLYQPLYYTRMNYLLPGWGGSYEAVEKFVGQAVERTSATEGSAFYAWIYLELAQRRNGSYEASLASWPRLKKGFEDMVARYPEQWNRNLFATLACQARDKETTGRLIAELRDLAYLAPWFPGVTTETCKRFALTPT
jgi:hypothetical protein